MELISRDEAVSILQDMYDRADSLHESTDGDDWAWEEMKALQFAIDTIEERKEGEWVYESCSRLIDETDEGRVYTIEKRWHCSRCGFSKGFMMYRPDEKYCPNCGAKMEEN